MCYMCLGSNHGILPEHHQYLRADCLNNRNAIFKPPCNEWIERGESRGSWGIVGNKGERVLDSGGGGGVVEKKGMSATIVR